MLGERATKYRFVVTSGAGAGAYTVDVAASSGCRNRIPGVTLDAQGRFTLPESALSPLESNAVRIRKDGQVGSGYSAPVSLAYDPTVTATSPNPVRALSIHWASNNLVVRWSLAQDTGKAQRLFFRSSDGLTTVLLTPTALPSSVLSYTLASQALSAPCGALYLETLEAAASPMAGLPSAAAGEQGIGMNPCPGGAPDPPSGPAFVNWYHHRDHLGTLRNVTDEAGYVVVGYDDYPYGARMPQSATPSVGGSTRQYTGHERDLATGLDYMGARYYGAGAGLFLSADGLAASARTGVPQTANRYAYVLGNPSKFADPTGDFAMSAATKDVWNQHVQPILAKTAEGRAFLKRAEADNKTRLELTDKDNRFQSGHPGGPTIFWNPRSWLTLTAANARPGKDGDYLRSPAVSLVHEASHAFDFAALGAASYSLLRDVFVRDIWDTRDNNGWASANALEKLALDYENNVAASLGEPIRLLYSGEPTLLGYQYQFQVNGAAPQPPVLVVPRHKVSVNDTSGSTNWWGSDWNLCLSLPLGSCH